MVFIYLILLASVPVLWIFAKDLELPEGMTEKGISRELYKVSLLIYMKIFRKRKPLEAEKIREYLLALNNSRDVGRIETEYFIRKISIFIVMAMAGSFLALMMLAANGKEKSIEAEGLINRRAFGGGSFETKLIASDEEGNELGRYELLVNERQYTKAEADRLFSEAADKMEKLILGENRSLDEVRSDLYMPERVEGYPFSISWKLDDYELMHFDGSLEKKKIPEEGAAVTLTAVYKYDEFTWQQALCARLMPENLTPAERIASNIEELLNNADKSSVFEDKISLPQSYEGGRIKWNEEKSDNSILILALTLVGGAASYVFKDKELKRNIEERQRQMLSDYPQLVSQIVLYLGAGMSIRNIFEKLGRSYLKKRQSSGEVHFVYEELLRAERELASGLSEADVYERFGIRCGGKQYTRLCTLLSQNLRKGNSSLLSALNEEATKAFNERMDNVRKLGEEAGTKLLLPMILMLVIVMAVIMIPAYMAF